MFGTVLQALGILAVIVVFATFLLRPAGVLPIVLAIGLVVAAVIVSARDVDRYWQQREQAARIALQNRQAPADVPASPVDTLRPNIGS